MEVIVKRLTFDGMMSVELASGVSTNDAGKRFSTGMYNNIRLDNCYFPETILNQILFY